MVVSHNLQAMNSNRIFKVNIDGTGKIAEKLSSGYRINRAADDACGLAISEKMRCQIRGLDRASTNALDGISVIQTAEGAFSEMQTMLHRMNELAVQSANDTNTDSDRLQIQREIKELVNEIDDTSMRTRFNTKPILNGFNTRNGYTKADGTPGEGVLSFEDAGVAFSSNFANASDIDEYGNCVVSMDNFGDRDGSMFILFPGSLADADTEKRFSNTKWGEVNLRYTENGVADIMSYLYNVSPVDASKPYISSAEEIGALMDKAYGGAADTKYYGSERDLADSFVARHGDDAKNASVVNEGGQFKINIQAYGDVNDPFEMKLQVGALSGQAIDVSIDHLNAKGLGITGLNVLDFDNAGKAMQKIQDAIDVVSTARAKLGAQQNRLEHTILNLDNTSENTQMAESRIRDTDMASAMMDFAKHNILVQMGQSIMAQANQSNQGVLALLA